MTSTRSTRVSGRDRMWTFASSTRTIGRFDGLRREGVLEALGHLAESVPDSRLFLRIDDDRRRWRLPQPGEQATLIERAVLGWEPMDPADMHRRLTALPLDDVPWRFVVCGDLIGIRMLHVFGDGTYVARLMNALGSAARTGRLPAGFEGGPAAFPLAHAFARQLRRKDALRLPAALRDHPAGPATEEVTVTGDIEQRHAYVAAHPGLLDELEAARGVGTPRPSVNALLLVRLRTALKDAGMPLADTSNVLFGVRRYLPPGALVEGNFAVPLPVRPADPEDALQTSAAINAITSSGLPLVALLRGSLRSRRLSGTRPPTTVRRFAEPMLVHSLLPSDPAFRALDRREVDPVLLISGPPPGLGAVTVNSFILDRQMHLCASYYRNDFDEDALRRALAVAAGVEPSAVGVLTVEHSLNWMREPVASA